MKFLVLGLNHQSAKVAIRERLAFGKDALLSVLTKLKSETSLTEAVILSTCNRTEIYCDAQDSQVVIDWLCQYRQIASHDLQDVWYVYHGAAALRHLMRVASGLDSMILGEPQILGQVKEAYQLAQQTQTLSAVFNKIFQHVFHVAKKVRSETDIGKNAVSVAYAAVSLAKHIFADVSRSKIIFIGAGEMIELAARHFSEQQAKAFYFVNRTLANAERLAAQFNASAYELHELQTLLPADIIVVATDSQEPLVSFAMMDRAQAHQKEKPVLLLDLAVPRNIESKVADIPDCYLYSVDDLQALVKENMEQRKAQALLAEEMIDIEVVEFIQAQRTQQLSNKIQHYIQEHETAVQNLLAELQPFSLNKDVLELVEKFSKKSQHQALRLLRESLKD